MVSYAASMEVTLATVADLLPRGARPGSNIYKTTTAVQYR